MTLEEIAVFKVGSTSIGYTSNRSRSPQQDRKDVNKRPDDCASDAAEQGLVNSVWVSISLSLILPADTW